MDPRALLAIVAVFLPVPRVLPLLCLLPTLLPAAPYTAFRDGEAFTYRVGFALFSRAGEITIAASSTAEDGRDLMRVTTGTSSRGLVRGVYAFDNEAEVLIDRPTGRIHLVRESGADPKRATDSETRFDYERRIAHHVDRVRTDRTTDIPIPDGDPLVQTRDWDLKPGEQRDVLVHFGRDLYPLAIKAEGYEEVRPPLGRFRTLVLVPHMKGEPKGLFKRGGQIKVWIAQDQTKLPVKLQLVLKYGTASLLLSEYRAPAAITTAAAAGAK